MIFELMMPQVSPSHPLTPPPRVRWGAEGSGWDGAGLGG